MLALVAAPTFAAAATVYVPVTLVVSAAEPFTRHEMSRCTVTVIKGGDAVQVLERAVRDGCIDSYETDSFSGLGRKVTCIDGLCEVPVTFWRFTVNGAMTDYGVDLYAARAGDAVGFSYTTWAQCLTPIGC